MSSVHSSSSGSLFPDPSLDSLDTPQINGKGDANPVKASGRKDLGGAQDAGMIRISDNEEPIAAIEAKVRAMALNDAAIGRIEIRSTFMKESPGSKNIKVIPYREPPNSLKAPDCYAFDRVIVVTVIGKDGQPKDLEFVKRIYTNVVIPKRGSDGKLPDARVLKDRAVMAGIAASTYSHFVEGAVYTKTGQPGKGRLSVEKDQITKVQRDRFIAMSLYDGKKKVSANLRKPIGASSRPISAIQLHIRGAKPDEVKHAQAKDTHTIIHLAEKVDDAVEGMEGTKKSRAEKYSEKTYVIVPDDNSSPEVIEIANIQKFRKFDGEYDNAEDLADALDAEGIDEEDYIQHVSEECARKTSDFNDRLSLVSDPSRIQELRNMYAPGYKKVSQEILDLAELQQAQKPKKFLGIPMGKAKVPEHELYDTLNKLIEASGDEDNSDAVEEELNLLIACCYKAYQEMKALSESINKDENIISDLATEGRDTRKDRNKVMGKIDGIFTDEGIDEGILTFLAPLEPPPSPKPGPVVSDEDEGGGPSPVESDEEEGSLKASNPNRNALRAMYNDPKIAGQGEYARGMMDLINGLENDEIDALHGYLEELGAEYDEGYTEFDLDNPVDRLEDNFNRLATDYFILKKNVPADRVEIGNDGKLVIRDKPRLVEEDEGFNSEELL